MKIAGCATTSAWIFTWIWAESGEPVNAEREFVFRVYDAALGGTPVWTSAAQDVDVAEGVFSLALEAGAPAVLSTATFSGVRYMEVVVNGVTLAPRQEMLSVPYALTAQALASDARVSPASLHAGPLGGDVLVSSVAVDAVYAGAIGAGAVTFVKMAGNGCAALEIMKRNADNTAWICAPDAGAGSGLTLAPPLPDTDGSANDSVYINDTGGGNLLRLQSSGADKFVVDGAGLLTTGSVGAARIAGGDLPATVRASSIAVAGVYSGAIASDAVNSAKIEDGSIIAADIANSTISLNKLYQSGCSTGEVAKWNGSSWACAADTDTGYTADTESLQLSGTVFSAKASSVTLQGNVFNTADRLVRLDGSGKLPAVDGSSLTGLIVSTTALVARIEEIALSTGTLAQDLDAVVLSTQPLSLATHLNTAATLVRRDGAGAFAAGILSVAGLTAPAGQASIAISTAVVVSASATITYVDGINAGVTVSSGLVVSNGGLRAYDGSGRAVYGAAPIGQGIGVYGLGGGYGVYGNGDYGLYGVGAITGVYAFGTDYDFYGDSGNDSYFKGGVGIGTTLIQAQLDVHPVGSMAQIWRNSGGTIVSSVSAAGVIKAVAFEGPLSGNAATATYAVTAATATNIAGGGAGRILYQTGMGATNIMPVGTSGQVLASGGTGAPTWVTATNLNTSNAVIRRDDNSGFSAGPSTFTAAVAGGCSGVPDSCNSFDCQHACPAGCTSSTFGSSCIVGFDFDSCEMIGAACSPLDICDWDGSTCNTVDVVAKDCTGTPTPCASFLTQGTCVSQDGCTWTPPGATALELISSGTNVLSLRKTAGANGSVRVFAAVSAITQTGTALCQTVNSEAVCLAQWTSTGTDEACANSIASARALCAAFGD